jgi:hypothetical protein
MTRASRVVVLCLLLSVATASAECAWVLWQESNYLQGRNIDTTWSVLSAWGDRIRCEDVRQGRISYIKTLHEGRTQQVEPDAVVVKWSDGSSTALRPVCLPDTVDPRGPKPK